MIRGVFLLTGILLFGVLLMEKNSGQHIAEAAFVISGAALGIYLLRAGLIAALAHDKLLATIIGAIAGAMVGWLVALMVEST